MPDLLVRVRAEIEARLVELRPLIAEIDRLEAASEALGAVGQDQPAPGRRRRRATAPRAKAGQNKARILAVISERPGVGVGEIAQVTRIARPTVASTVSKLKGTGELESSGRGVRLRTPQPDATEQSQDEGHQISPPAQAAEVLPEHSKQA